MWKLGDFGVFFLGQDKGHGPKPSKPLSAHRFFRDTQVLLWDTESAGLPMAPEKSTGTRPQKGYF